MIGALLKLIVAVKILIKILDWLQSLTQLLINVLYHILLATSILYDTLMLNCFKDWSQSMKVAVRGMVVQPLNVCLLGF